MYENFKDVVSGRLEDIRQAGLYKAERSITSTQQAQIISEGKDLLNFCANNYLGLANDERIKAAAVDAISHRGFGVASVRFIAGTQDIHKELEASVSKFLETADTILFSSCFDANGGVFESLFGEGDVIISDELNHASIIDGIRLSKASRQRYRNRDMADLERALVESQHAQNKIIVTDGVFSMDGYIAPLREICDLAEKYGAVVMVDDSHAVGLIGAGGRGTAELLGVQDRVDIFTGTFGKALGGAAGGYVSGKAEIVELLRQKARPYLFSNSLAPAIVAGSLEAIRIASDPEEGVQLRANLQANSKHFRDLMQSERFELLPGEHPIVPVMFGDARLATEIASNLFNQGIYVTAFSFPVVPREKARIRVQISAAHTFEQIERCVAAFISARDQVRL